MNDTEGLINWQDTGPYAAIVLSPGVVPPLFTPGPLPQCIEGLPRDSVLVDVYMERLSREPASERRVVMVFTHPSFAQTKAYDTLPVLTVKYMQMYSVTEPVQEDVSPPPDVKST